MSRSRKGPRLGLALTGATLVILAVLLPSRAEAQFGLRGGPLGVARFAVGHVIGMSRLRHARMAVRGGRYRSAALRSQDPRGVERGQPANPYMLRAAMTAQGALSGWRDGRRPQGWWRHPDGSYGWVGPVFWPFAHDDLTSAIILGDTTSLSLYGYGDIYAAIFAPYAATELAAYTAPQGRRGRRVPTAETVCDASDTGGLPVDRIAAIVQSNELQRTALDELATAWLSARDTIRAACPTQVPATATERLGLMRERIEAMIKATDAVAPAAGKIRRPPRRRPESQARWPGQGAPRRARGDPAKESPGGIGLPGGQRSPLRREAAAPIRAAHSAAMARGRDRLHPQARRHRPRPPRRAPGHHAAHDGDAQRLSVTGSTDTTGTPHRREGAAGDDAAGGERRQRCARRFRGGSERRAEGGVRGDRAEARGVITRRPSRTSCP